MRVWLSSIWFNRISVAITIILSNIILCVHIKKLFYVSHIIKLLWHIRIQVFSKWFGSCLSFYVRIHGCFYLPSMRTFFIVDCVQSRIENASMLNKYSFDFILSFFPYVLPSDYNQLNPCFEQNSQFYIDMDHFGHVHLC